MHIIAAVPVERAFGAAHQAQEELETTLKRDFVFNSVVESTLQTGSELFRWAVRQPVPEDPLPPSEDDEFFDCV